MMTKGCLFCDGDASEPGHFVYCDGRQGVVEAHEPVVPPLVSGLVPETYQTSEAAAQSIEDERETQRRLVYVTIREAGAEGHTDDELQVMLALDGSSERPRRWELWKLNMVTIRRDADGKPVRRLTRTSRWANVWVAA